ncbi:MAG: tetratricopeptide repeat protein [Candidatus Omnitrophica bacterium]|nr:tetratricopeptide repeat protein [Candidatus Omnitrophota bacterium]MCB9720986.1 tetratricopeptide repeat protein [Candidatus Omnitrophota bacterium]
MRISLAIFIILIGISLLTYRNGLRGEFMHEDTAYLLSSSFRVPAGAMKDALLPRADDNFYRPLTRIYDSWTYQRFGENMLPHRLINIICLALTGVLVFLLVKNITSHTGTGLLASILFCVHPINSTPVLYVAMPVMPYATFFLLSLLCYTDFFERRQRWDLLILSGLFFALSFLVHEITLCLPVYVFLYAWQLRGSGWRTAVLHTFPYLLIALAYLIFRLTFVSNTMDVIGLTGYITEENGVTVGSLLCTIIRNIALYTGKLFWPEGILWNLRVADQTHISLPWLLSPLAAAGALIWIFRRSWRKSIDLFLILWFVCGFIMLAATSFVHPSSGIGIEPHWFIASSVGFFGLTARLMIRLRETRLSDRIWKAGLGCVVLFLGYFTNTYTLRWQYERPYLQYWLAHDPSADLPNFWLALIYHKEGNHQLAATLYCRALTGGYIDWEVYYNLGNIYHQNGFYDKAIGYYNQAHRWNPDSSAVHHNAAMSYFALGNARRAEELLLRAQKFDPESTTVRDSLEKVRRYLESHE